MQRFSHHYFWFFKCSFIAFHWIVLVYERVKSIQLTNIKSQFFLIKLIHNLVLCLHVCHIYIGNVMLHMRALDIRAMLHLQASFNLLIYSFVYLPIYFISFLVYFFGCLFNHCGLINFLSYFFVFYLCVSFFFHSLLIYVVLSQIKPTN